MYIQVFLPEKLQINSAGWRKYEWVPALFSDGTTYLPEPNRYLREIATGEWRAARDSQQSARSCKPTAQTLKNIAQSLANFLRWCAEHHDRNGKFAPLDWKELTYIENIIDGYQLDMLEGRWGTHALKASTANIRADEATRFLEWAAWRNFRAPFPVEKAEKNIEYIRPRHSHGHRPKTIAVRIGRQRVNPAQLTLPNYQDTGQWLSDVYDHYGHTKGLMCELILRTGIRLSECIKWRLDTLPEQKSEWRITRDGNYVETLIRAGCKGSAKMPDEHGNITLHPRGRYIHLPIDLAEKLKIYASTRRPHNRGSYILSKRAAKSEKTRREKQQDPLELFLSDFTGRPISGQTLRSAWGIKSKPINYWSPHLGRHFYACYFLLDRIKEQAQLLRNIDKKTALIVASSPAFVENYWQVLRQQLGHIDKSTTERYTVWLRLALQILA